MCIKPRRFPGQKQREEQARKARLLPGQRQKAALLQWVAACAGDISLCASWSDQVSRLRAIPAQCYAWRTKALHCISQRMHNLLLISECHSRKAAAGTSAWAASPSRFGRNAQEKKACMRTPLKVCTHRCESGQAFTAKEEMRAVQFCAPGMRLMNHVAYRHLARIKAQKQV